jgi:hypothetical protein
MLPSNDDIANFLAVAPDAGGGKAFMFLEVKTDYSNPTFSPSLVQSSSLADLCLEHRVRIP